MRDLKAQKAGRIKGNRRRKTRSPFDWKKTFRVGLRLAVGLASVGLIVTGGMLVTQVLFASDYFRIETVRVENNRRVSAEEVADLSEIERGGSIFNIDLQAIGRKIEENPWIAAAEVERVFPREVVIRVTEREPRAVINLGYLYYIDASGEVFKMLEPGDKLDYPAITGIERKFLLENPAEARRLLVDAVSLLGELTGRSSFNLKQVSELHYDQDDGFMLTTMTGGVPVRMGFGNFAGKLDRLERIYPELQTRLTILKYIDLNVTDRVIVRVESKFAPGNS